MRPSFVLLLICELILVCPSTIHQTVPPEQLNVVVNDFLKVGQALIFFGVDGISLVNPIIIIHIAATTHGSQVCYLVDIVKSCHSSASSISV